MSTAEKQPNGTWKGVGRVYGQPKRTKNGFPTKAMALSWADHEETQMKAIKTGSLVEGTLEFAITKYLDKVTPTKRGAKWEESRLNGFLKGTRNSKAKLPLKKLMSKITSTELAHWRDARLTEVKGSSVRREMNLLDAVFEVSRKEWRLLDKNPLKDVKKPPQSRPRTAVWSQSQIAQVTFALGYTPTGIPDTQEKETALAFLIELESGMRSGEILGLTEDQVFLNDYYVHLDLTKNGDERDVPLSPAAVEMFKQLLQVRHDLNENGERPLFSIDSKSRDSKFRNARDRCCIEGVTFHDGRATALTRLSKIYTLMELAKISGHRDPKSLLIYYRESASSLAEKMRQSA